MYTVTNNKDGEPDLRFTLHHLNTLMF